MTRITMPRNLIFALCLCLFAACGGCNSARNPEADKIAVKKVLLQMDDARREGKNTDTAEAYMKQTRTALKKINVRSCPEDFRVAFEEFRSAKIKRMEFDLKMESKIKFEVTLSDKEVEEYNRLEKKHRDTSDRLKTIAKLYDVKWDL